MATRAVREIFAQARAARSRSSPTARRVIIALVGEQLCEAGAGLVEALSDVEDDAEEDRELERWRAMFPDSERLRRLAQPPRRE